MSCVRASNDRDVTILIGEAGRSRQGIPSTRALAEHRSRYKTSGSDCNGCESLGNGLQLNSFSHATYRIRLVRPRRNRKIRENKTGEWPDSSGSSIIFHNLYRHRIGYQEDPLCYADSNREPG